MFGEAVASSSMASQTRNFLTAARHEPSAEKIWDTKSQNVRKGGKEPLPLRVSERRLELDPRPEKLPEVREQVLAEWADACGELPGPSGHDRASFRFRHLRDVLQVYILVTPAPF